MTRSRRVRVGSRGQLLLAGAFVLAVGIIGLTFVLNTSVQTDALAESETGVARGSDALSTREAVRTDLGDFLETVHLSYSEGTPPDTRSPYKQAFRAGLPALGTGIRDHHAAMGQLVNVSFPSSGATFRPGVEVRQTHGPGGVIETFAEPTARTNPARNGANWTNVVRDATLRNMTFVIEREVDPSKPPFRIVFDDVASGSDWMVKIYEGTSAPDRWRLWVYNGGAPVGSCTGPRTTTPSGGDNPVRVDLSDGQFGGDYCNALARLDPKSPYDLDFEFGNNSVGRFWMTSDNPGSVSPLFGIRSTETEDVLYGVRVLFEYYSSTVDYESDLVITPEEV